MGSVRVYFIGRKVFKTKAGEVEKTVIHYEMGGVRYAFASNRKDFVADMAELAKLIARPTEQNPQAQTSMEAEFSWPKGGTLSVTVP